jgi:hypothetical protein
LRVFPVAFLRARAAAAVATTAAPTLRAFFAAGFEGVSVLAIDVHYSV